MRYLICPLCGLPLSGNSQGLACENRHQFDRAKEGYFNLLPVQQKNSREPGDAVQQLKARRQFLNAGFFSALISKLGAYINPNIESMLDVGCGEGYFTRALSERCPKANVYGIDIAKSGVRLAAKGAGEQITYAVASSYSLPIASHSMDLITRIYAPSKDEELARVLKPQGQLVIVTPGEHHLLGIRKKIYRQLKPYSQPAVPAGFNVVEQSSAAFPLQVPAGDLTSALLQMTPFTWKLTPDLLAEFYGQGVMDEADFCITIYEKNIC